VIRPFVRRAAALVLALAGTTWAQPGWAGIPSQTTLTLSSTESVYGQTVTASALVSNSSGQPEGDVLFTVDGATVKANVSGAGAASIVLPRALVGVHSVAATYVPSDARRQDGSTSGPQAWVVVPAATHLQVDVRGHGARRSLEVRAAGQYGTIPTGRVRVTVRHLGTRTVIRSVRRLDEAGLARSVLRRLTGGSNRARVTYVGDGQHGRVRQVVRFRVRRG
jgi:hypothetical protein